MRKNFKMADSQSPPENELKGNVLLLLLFELKTKLLLLFGLLPFPSLGITCTFPFKTIFEEANFLDLRIECV